MSETTRLRRGLPAMAVAAALAACVELPRVRDLPPEPKRKNPKAAKQAAARKARATARKAHKR